MKDKLGLRTMGILEYNLVSEEWCMSQNDHSMTIRVNTTCPPVSTREVDMAGHIIHLGHCILFSNISILCKIPRHRNQLLRDVTEMMLHPSNMNRKDEL
jgi:hypothetical protein